MKLFNFYYLARCQVHGFHKPFCHADRQQAIRGLKNSIHACNFHFLENLPFFRSFSMAGASIVIGPAIKKISGD